MLKILRISRICFILILYYISTSGLNAQDMANMTSGIDIAFPVPGYIVFTNGDTLPGMIKWAMKYVENNPVEIKVTAENGNSKSFRAGEISACGTRTQKSMEEAEGSFYLGPENWVSVPSFKKGTPVFMHRLFNGRLTVYQNRSAAIINTSKVEETTRFDGIGFQYIPGEGLYIGPTYHTDYRVIEFRCRYSSYYTVKDGGKMVKVEKENYEELFGSLFGDCEAVGQEINRNPDLKKFRNFMILAEIYSKLCNQ